MAIRTMSWDILTCNKCRDPRSKACGSGQETDHNRAEATHASHVGHNHTHNSRHHGVSCEHMVRDYNPHFAQLTTNH